MRWMWLYSFRRLFIWIESINLMDVNFELNAVDFVKQCAGFPDGFFERVFMGDCQGR